MQLNKAKKNLPLHGGETDRKVHLDFSVNVNPMGIPESVKACLANLETEILRYPDRTCRELRTNLKDAIEKEYRVKIKADWILPGNGASELIQSLCQVIRPKRALITVPSFSGYERALKNCGAEILYESLQEEEDFALTDRLLIKLKSGAYKPDLIFLCQPGNPVGNTIPKDRLLAIAGFCLEQGIFLILDECFAELLPNPGDRSLVAEVHENPYLVIIRAFTKTYAMPGLRLGYLITSNRILLDRLADMLPEWNVSGPAQAAGCAALTDADYLSTSRILIQQERKYLETELQRLGVEVFPGEANFLLFGVPEDGGALWEQLLKKQKILIRDCGNYRGLQNPVKHFYRVAVCRHEENELLIESICSAF